MGTGPGQTNLVKTILRPGIDETNKVRGLNISWLRTRQKGGETPLKNASSTVGSMGGESPSCLIEVLH